MTSVGRASGLEPLGLADSHAEEALFRRNSSKVFGFCMSRLRRREDAEDALQTTFLYAFRSLRRGVVPLVESAWLLGIARNVCLERWEATGKRSRVETPWDPAELDRTAPAVNDRPDELIGLEDALTRLPAQQRRAVVLRDWRGLSYDEVAEEMGVSHAAVETLIFRGRRSLAEYLRDGARATRRKLASFANLGSLASAAKTLFGGSAAAIKVAAALTVVAVSGAGIAVGESALHGGGSEPSRPAEPQRAQQAPAVPMVSGNASAPSGPQAAKPKPKPKPGGSATAPAAKRIVPSPKDSSAPAAEPAGATPAPSPTSAAHPTGSTTVSPVLKGSTRKTAEVAKTVTATVPLPPVLANAAPVVEKTVEELPVAPVVGAVEDAAAPVVEPVVAGVEDATAPVVDPVVSTAGDVVSGLPPVPPLLP